MLDGSSREWLRLKPSAGGWRVALVALLTVVVLFFAAQIIGAFAVYTVPAVHHWSSDQAEYWLKHSVVAQFVYGLVADGLLMAGVVGMMMLLRWQPADIGLKRPKWWHLIGGLAAVVPYVILYVAIVDVVGVLVPGFDANQKQEIGFSNVQGPLALSLAFLGLVVVPALAEEIAMRGFLYSGLKRWLPRIAAALVVSALFGAAHLSEGGAAGLLWVGALDTFILSLILVFLREKTGNLWAGITLHATKNCVAFVSLFVLHLG